MDFQINKILEKDINKIYELGISNGKYSADGGKNCFWPKDTLKELIKSQKDVTLKLVVENKIVGFSLVMIHPITKKAIIENFYILDNYKFLENEFYLEVEKAIKKKDAEFIAYYYNLDKDPNSLDLFKKFDYYDGNKRIWLHKNICFSNKVIKK